MADETATKPHKPRKARQPKPQPTPEQLAQRQALKSWTSWKLDTQRAIIADKRIPASDVRLLLFLLHEMNQNTGIAIVYDSRIRDEVHGYAVDTTIYRTRKRLCELGWLRYVPGSGLNATVYRVLDDNVKGVMSRVKILAEDRREVQERRKALRNSGKESLHSQHQQDRVERRKPKSDPLHIATQVSATDAWLSPSLTPSALQKATGRSQDVELRPDSLAEAEVSWCADCGTMVEADGGPRCTECESDAKARCVIDFPRSEAGEFLCIDCGTETRIAAAHSADDPFCPFCPACIEANDFTHRDQIDPSMSPIEVMWPASRTMPGTSAPIDQRPANDPGAEYRRARDGG